jgi:redox-sensitive bicupin YhaK (pirin superfamily)
MVGPFIFFDQMGPAEFLTNQGIDVRPHPHINLATLTYLLKGEIVHKDSLGSDLPIRPGEVNLMSAGKGIVHSERTSEHHKQHGQTLFGLQTWMALPINQEEGSPAFTHLGRAELPTIDAEGIHARVIAGSALGVNSPLITASPTLYVHTTLSPRSQLPVPTDYIERAIYLLSGEISIDNSQFSAGQLVILKRNQEVVIKASDHAEFMLFGGEPMDGPRYIWWNFVSSRIERIELAKEEWSQGVFDTVPGDEDEFIPLPADEYQPRLAKGSD